MFFGFIGSSFLYGSVSLQFQRRKRAFITPLEDLRLVASEATADFYSDVSPQSAVKRLLAFAPYADLLWFETNTPSVDAATRVARTVRAQYPGKRVHDYYTTSYAANIDSAGRQFVYNLSPSFNWAAHGFSGKSVQRTEDETKANLSAYIQTRSSRALFGTLRKKGLFCIFHDN